MQSQPPDQAVAKQPLIRGCWLAERAAEGQGGEWGLGAMLRTYMQRVHGPALRRRGVQGAVLALFATSLLASLAMLPRVSRYACVPGITRRWKEASAGVWVLLLAQPGIMRQQCLRVQCARNPTENALQ